MIDLVVCLSRTFRANFWPIIILQVASYIQGFQEMQVIIFWFSITTKSLFLQLNMTFTFFFAKSSICWANVIYTLSAWLGIIYKRESLSFSSFAWLLIQKIFNFQRDFGYEICMCALQIMVWCWVLCKIISVTNKLNFWPQVCSLPLWQHS